MGHGLVPYHNSKSVCDTTVAVQSSATARQRSLFNREPDQFEWGVILRARIDGYSGRLVSV